MAESLQHQALVLRIVSAISIALGDTVICLVDRSENPDSIPYMIGNFRPDVYAASVSITVVGEAKTAKDLEKPRTAHQLRAFLEYVQVHSSRHLVLAVHWTNAATAKSVLRNASSDWAAVRGRVHILDGIYPLNLSMEDVQGAPRT